MFRQVLQDVSPILANTKFGLEGREGRGGWGPGGPGGLGWVGPGRICPGGDRERAVQVRVVQVLVGARGTKPAKGSEGWGWPPKPLTQTCIF